MQILLIDDDTEDAELFCEALKDVNPGVQCIRFNRIPQALDHLLADGAVPTAIFLDAHLPSGNTMEFLSKLRALSRLDKARIFIYSGFVSDSEKIEYRRLGATDVISKPHHFHDLRSMLKKLVTPLMEGA